MILKGSEWRACQFKVLFSIMEPRGDKITKMCKKPILTILLPELIMFILALQDGELTEEEVVEKYDLFVGSQATDFGEELTRHDEF